MLKPISFKAHTSRRDVEEITFEQANAYALMAQEKQHAIEEQKPLPITLEDSMETMAIIELLFSPNNDDYWVENP